MTFSKDLKPKGEGGTLYTSRDLAAMQAEINALKAATAQLENQLADMADLTNTTVLRANAVQTHDISANLAVFGTAVVEGELAVSNGSGNDKDVIVNRNGVPEWGTPTDINAVNVLVTDTVTRATTVDHTGTVNEADSVQNVDQCETVGEAQTVTQGNTVTHADLVQVADVIQQTGDAQIVGDLDVTGSITQGGATLDDTYLKSVNGITGDSSGDATLTGVDIKTSPTSQVTLRERLQNWLYVKGQGDAQIKNVDGYTSLQSVLLITFDVSNVYQGAMKLYMSGGYYDLYINGEVSSATNYTIDKGTYIARYIGVGINIEVSASVPLARESMSAQALDDAYVKTLVDMFYRVGFVISTFDSTNPGDYIKGSGWSTTWKAVGEGRVLIGAGSNKANTTSDYGTVTAGDINRTAGELGGEYSHTLSSTEMPSHKHSFTPSGSVDQTSIVGTVGNFFQKGDEALYKSGCFSTSESVSGSWNLGGSGLNSKFTYVKFNGDHAHTFTGSAGDTNPTGSGSSHNNIQPYTVVYMWRRTA